MKQGKWQIAVVGAGPVGLALALHARSLLPQAQITVFDARPLDRDVSADPRAVALALGSVQFLKRLSTQPPAWPEHAAQPIAAVQVSQTPPSAPGALASRSTVTINASEVGVPMLGAVLRYGALVAPLQQAWLAAASQEPQRLLTCFGQPVAALEAMPDGRVRVRTQALVPAVDALAEGASHEDDFDLAVVAEGGVFSDQARKAITHDYAQSAWVGTVELEGAVPGTAFERFTRHGPVALLPLPPKPGLQVGRTLASLVWCVGNAEDPVRELNDAQRITVLNTLLPDEAGRIAAISALKVFPLGLNAERSLVGAGSPAQLAVGENPVAATATTRVQGRVVRIGNAAQTLHPVAGQGLNLGLRDAHVLVQALRHATDVSAALRQVEWSRAPDRWSMIAATDFLARSFTWKLPGLELARGLGLAAVQSLPPLKALIARRMMFGGR